MAINKSTVQMLEDIYRLGASIGDLDGEGFKEQQELLVRGVPMRIINRCLECGENEDYKGFKYLIDKI